MISDFFSTLWNVPPQGFQTFWFAPSRLSNHLPIDLVIKLTDNDFEELKNINLGKHADFSQPQHVYFGLGLRFQDLGSLRQGEKSDIIALPAFALDIDIFSEVAHKADNLPKNPEEAYKIFSHLPDPTLIVDSGYGLQVYWVLKEPVIWKTNGHEHIENYFKKFQENCISRASEFGWNLDKTYTIQRVWRIPGFYNWKDKQNPKLVETLFVDKNNRYEIKELIGTNPSVPTEAAGSPTVLLHGSDHQATREPSVSLEDQEDMLKPLVYALQQYRGDHQSIITAILEGRPFATTGHREEFLRNAVAVVTRLPQGRHLDPELIGTIFKPSLEAMARAEDNPVNPSPSLEEAVSKIRRAQHKWDAQDKEQEKSLSGLRSVIKKRNTDLDEQPQKDSDDNNPVISDIQYSIIQYKTLYYVFNYRKQRYERPRLRDELASYLPSVFRNTPVVLDYATDKGVIKDKDLKRVLKEYSTNAHDLIYSNIIQSSEFDVDTQTFYEAVCPLRKLESRYDEEIAHWLELLVGTSHLNTLLDWLATVTNLEYMTAALYLSGPHSTGKTILANGIARLWSVHAPTEISKFFGNFNADILKCPLIVADEYVPKGKDISKQLRLLIGSRSRTISVKYAPNATLHGALRLILLGNNKKMLAIGDEELEAADYEATSIRFIHIETRQAANEYVLSIGGPRKVNPYWLTKDYLARHILWLKENRQVESKGRFLVEGNKNDFKQQQLMAQGADISLVQEWLARFLSEPKTLMDFYKTKKLPYKAMIGEGFLWVNSQAVQDCWSLYLAQEFKTNIGKIGSFLRIFSKNDIGRYPDKNGLRFHKIPGRMVLDWAVENQISEEEPLQERLKQPVKDFFAPILKLVTE